MTTGPGLHYPKALGWAMSSNARLDEHVFQRAETKRNEHRDAQAKVFANIVAEQEERDHHAKRTRRRLNIVAALTFTTALGLFCWAAFEMLSP